MTLQPLTPVNCAGLLQPGFSLLQLDGEVLLFGQKGWPMRSCPTGVFSVRFKCGEMKLRANSFSNDSCYLPPLRCPAKELVGEVPGARYGHTMSVVHSCRKTACVLFGGRSYMPAGERTTESWNSVVDRPPQVFLFDLEFGCCSAHALPALTYDQSFYLALAREDCVYLIGGHSVASDSRPPRLFRLRVELLQGSPLLSCEALATDMSISSAIINRTGRSDSQKRMECSAVSVNESGIHFEPLESPRWTPDITHSRTWFGSSVGEGSILLAVPTEGRPSQADMHYFYKVSFPTEEETREEEGTQGCSQDSAEYDDSTPLEDSEELYFGREPHELEDSDDGRVDNYNEEDEEDESQADYWIKCCLGCQVDPNIWEPYYSTEEGGHWVHSQCMDLSETLLLRLSQGSKRYFCLDHGGLPHQEMTPPRQVQPLKLTPMKVKDRKTPPTINLSPAKKLFLRRLFE
uniref:V(D)J recombination-activating protein 2 n=1 Tax=Gasterosteus aculeatus aculeatus TaxID=481459 RepID=A0AAQ4NXE1_GASAC